MIHGNACKKALSAGVVQKQKRKLQVCVGPTKESINSACTIRQEQSHTQGQEEDILYWCVNISQHFDETHQQLAKLKDAQGVHVCTPGTARVGYANTVNYVADNTATWNLYHNTNWVSSGATPAAPGIPTHYIYKQD